MQFIPAVPRLLLLVILSSLGVTSLSAQLRLVAPNGGERFLVGSTTTIRWSGVAPSDTVSLEYSTDGGAGWNLITSKATGLQFAWTGIPNAPSTRCLLRVSRSRVVGDSVLYLKSTRAGSPIAEAIHYAEFSPDGSRVAGGGAEGDVYFWDAFSGQLLNTMTVEVRANIPAPPGITLISRILYSPDGSLLATISPIRDTAGSTVRIFDVATRTKLREWARNDSFPGSTSGTAVWSPDGTRLLVMGLDGGTIYRVSDGAALTQVTGYTFKGPLTTEFGSMVEGDWSSDGTTIIGGSLSSSLIANYVLSDPTTGDSIREYRYATKPLVNSVRFNPAGTRFIATSFDGAAIVYQVSDRSVIFDIHDYARYPNWGEYSHNGRFFATAGQDIANPNWKLRLYDAVTGTFVKTVGAIINGMRNVEFSPDDSRILVSCIDGVRIFQTPDTTLAQSDVSDSLWEIFLAPGGVVTVSAPTVTARQGDSISIPISISDPALALGSGATRIDVRLHYNVTLLEPLTGTPLGTFDTAKRHLTLSFPIPTSGDTILGRLAFRAALGNDSVTVLDLEGATSDAPTLTLLERDGLFRLADLCLQGGPRLLNPNRRVSLKSVVNPARNGTLEADVETIEQGRASLLLIDLHGETVRQWYDTTLPIGHWRLSLPLDGISSGRYMLVLETPTVRKSVAVEVVR